MSADVPSLALRRATDADIDFIMRVERLPGYERFVGRSNRDEHAQRMMNSDFLYLVGAAGGAPAGFAILGDIGNRYGGVYLRRIAIENPGLGLGLSFIDAVVDWAFRETATHRLWLNVLSENMRARRAYEKRGFSDDGAQRQSFLLPDGTRADQRLMSILRGEWLALRERPGS